MPPAPRPTTFAEWRPVAEYKIGSMEKDIGSIEQRLLALEHGARDSMVDAAEFRAGVLTRSQAPEVLEAAKALADARAQVLRREAAYARMRQFGWAIALLIMGFALSRFWEWYSGPK